MSESTPTGFFTLGVSPERYELPHQRFGLPVILLIRRVLCRAFEMLRHEEFKLAEAKEDEVTAALRAQSMPPAVSPGSSRTPSCFLSGSVTKIAALRS